MEDYNLLSDIQIRKAKQEDKEYHLSDGAGLSLLVKTNGSKLWVMRYTSPVTKKRRKTSFGNYPKISLKMARDKRDEYIKLIFDDIDPLEKKKEIVKQNEQDINGRCDNLINEWLQKERQNTIESTHKSKVRVFNNDVLPLWKNIHIKDIGIQDVVKLVREKEKNAPEIASRLYSYLDNFFKYAVLEGYIESNLLRDIRKSDVVKPRVAKHMPKISDKEIFGELVNAIYDFDGSISVKNALKLVLHVPLRAENLCNLKWDYIDFENKLLKIPREEMKVKNINLDDFVLPLTNEVMNILNEQKEFITKYTDLREYVFIGSDNVRPIHNESPNRALQRMDFNNEKKGRKIRLHGFRGTFRSMIETLDVDGKFSFDVKEKVLDHFEKSKVVRAYTHKANFEQQLKELLNFWSDFINSFR